MTQWPIPKAELYRAICESQAQDACTDELGEMLLLMAQKYAYKPSFIGYSWREDMVSAGVLNLLHAWRKFDVKQPNPQPFAYMSTCLYNSFIRTIQTENEQRDIKDDLLVSMGVTPSWHGQDHFE